MGPPCGSSARLATVPAPTISTFRQLHEAGTFVLPNPWDRGSARILQAMGFAALATTSSGHAASLAKQDGTVTRSELVAHVMDITGAVEIPLNVDAERCFADTPEGVAETVRLLAEAGAAGVSLEDWDPVGETIDPLDLSLDRMTAAVEAARDLGIVLTARAENHIRGIDDLQDTLHRLSVYQEAGADVLYAPGLADPGDITAVVELGLPVNVLALPSGPSVPQLAELGVRRVSVGGSLARAAYGALVDGATELLEAGTSTYLTRSSGIRQASRLLG